MNIYSLADNEKVVSSSELNSLFSNILANLYLESLQINKDKTFQILIETVKEEASEAEEVLNREKWTLVNQDTETCKSNETATGIVKIEWGYVNSL